MANQIVHISDRSTGRPYCGKQNPHKMVTSDDVRWWQRTCVKCQQIKIGKDADAATKLA